ncbi:MAG: hypothetical protein LIO78_08400 [Clostridiales bacterium]|nr:hypothetical protein [Clostridiales bacterium]MCC8100062.1 hypothetical protein [Clostridiales bacterium]
MMDYETLRGALQTMAEDMPWQVICQSCGHEHNCGTNGECAILRDAIATMEQLYKDVSGICDCCAHSGVSADNEPCASCLDARRGFQPSNWQWRGVQKEATP